MKKPKCVKIWERNGIMIALFFITGDSWEVYYRKPDYPFKFAFGLHPASSKEEAVRIAEGNIDYYHDLFD